jgi:nucleoid DNA-binding protein
VNHESFIDSLSIRLGLSRLAARHLMQGLRDEILVQVASGNSVVWPGLGSFDLVVREAKTCVSNLPGRWKRLPVAKRMRLKFALYSSVHQNVEHLRKNMVKGLFGVHGSDRRIKVEKKKKQKKSVEVSIPSDVSEITIKIEKGGKRSESVGRKKLLG